MRELFIHPLFFVGLVIRLALMTSLAPLAAITWYVPFLDVSTSVLTTDPWSTWITSGGEVIAFPYGYVMWLTFLPLIITAKMMGLPLLYAYGSTLLLVDCCLLWALHQLIPAQRRLVLLAYWLSPVIIVASYGFGFNDLVPVLLLILSILSLKHLRFRFAGVLLAAAISAKLSMVVMLPFFVIYLLNNSPLRLYLSEFLTSIGLGVFILGGAFLASEAGLGMLIHNPEMGKIYQLSIELVDNVRIFITPLFYFVIIYLVWRFRRLNFDLFMAVMTVTFLLIVLMTPASPGWMIWCVPFLVFYQAKSGRKAIVFVGVFSALYVLSSLMLEELRFFDGSSFELDSAVIQVPRQVSSYVASLLHTVMVAIGAILAIRIWWEFVGRNDFFRLSRKPFAIGIAGDSGSGKDTFADAISGLFGEHSVVKLSGDNYHLWDRQKPMWQVMTHLNPMANDLERFSDHLLRLIDGRTIQSRYYDHHIGKMTKLFKINSNDFIIASGLHTLYLPVLRECCDLKIYMDMDEGLRRYFKIKRDVHQRGHTLERALGLLEKRDGDARRFIRPQCRHANLIFSLRPTRSVPLKEGLDIREPLPLKLVVTSKSRYNERLLYRILVGIFGLYVDVDKDDNGTEMQLSVEGEISSDDIAMSAKMLCPDIQDFLDIAPKWQDGVLGLMQLITISHINQVLLKRFLK